MSKCREACSKSRLLVREVLFCFLDSILKRKNIRIYSFEPLIIELLCGFLQIRCPHFYGIGTISEIIEFLLYISKSNYLNRRFLITESCKNLSLLYFLSRTNRYDSYSSARLEGKITGSSSFYRGNNSISHCKGTIFYQKCLV